MDTNQYVWRGTYGDTAPVRIHVTNALDCRGGMLDDHYQSEEAAWGNILACMESDVNVANKQLERAQEEVTNSRRHLVYRRTRYAESCRAFNEWKALHPKQAVAV